MTKETGWRCPKCGNHYFMHVIRGGRPVCEILKQFCPPDPVHPS